MKDLSYKCGMWWEMDRPYQLEVRKWDFRREYILHMDSVKSADLHATLPFCSVSLNYRKEIFSFLATFHLVVSLTISLQKKPLKCWCLRCLSESPWGSGWCCGPSSLKPHLCSCTQNLLQTIAFWNPLVGILKHKGYWILKLALSSVHVIFFSSKLCWNDFSMFIFAHFLEEQWSSCCFSKSDIWWRSPLSHWGPRPARSFLLNPLAECLLRNVS